MFNSKQTTLLGSNKQTSATTKSAFVAAGMKRAARTLSGNLAPKYSTTGNTFVDQFGKMGSYKQPRSFDEVATDMSTLWAINSLMTVMFTFFIRIITRVVTFFNNERTSVPQRGAGLRHEGMLRMIWLHLYHPDTFWKNIQLYISVGSWRDVFQMLSFDLQYNGWSGRQLNWENFGKLILAGLENPNTTNLVKKYLPQIKANSTCHTIGSQADNMIAKWIANLLFGAKTDGTTYKKYRKLKVSGTAHQWQQLISQGKHDLVDFDTVHGRALALMVSGKYLENQGLTAKYEAWISSKPIAKYTGYACELFAKPFEKVYQQKTINAQFMQLVETAKKGALSSSPLIVVRDTSASMSGTATGTKQSCGDVAKALALFFSYMLPDGAFANSWIEFNSSAQMHTWKGSTPVEKWKNDHSSYVGSTDFMSVIRLFAKIRKSGVDEKEFPTGIICVSDGEFNPAALGTTNVQAARKLLTSAGFSSEYVKNFKIILWNLQSGYYGSETGKKFETYGETENVFYFSGYDGSIIAFLTGVDGQKSIPKTDVELFNAAMEQEVMSLIEL